VERCCPAATPFPGPKPPLSNGPYGGGKERCRATDGTALWLDRRTGGALNVDYAAIVRRAVARVAANGDASLQETVEARKLVVNGRVVPKPAGYPVATQTLSTRGLLVAYSLRNAAPADNPAECEEIVDLNAMLLQTPTPPRPMHRGETWKTEIKNRLVPGQKIVYLSTLVGPAKAAGKNVVHVKFAVNIPLVNDPGPVDSMDASGEYDVDPVAGVLVRGAYTVDAVQFHTVTDTAKVVLSARFTLLDPGAKAPNLEP
jgi:hypothetical protein